jgi:mannose-1-phosphate guanylyltransferase
MTISSNSWAIVLAGGEGSRLQSLTTDDSGDPVPKQFCSLRGGQTLLAETLQRAASVVEPNHICVIVAAQHRRWWEPMLSEMTKSNIIVQPSNRGTGNGVLLPRPTVAGGVISAHRSVWAKRCALYRNSAKRR